MFLDHDGVICLSSEWGSRFKNKEGLDSHFDRFNAKALDVLNEIIAATDCDIVISSDWRHHCTVEQMQELYTIRGIIKTPVAFTGYVASSAIFLELARIEEIELFLSEHPSITNWCAVDDMDLGEKFDESGTKLSGLKNFVRTPSSREGIKQTSKKEKIIKFLNQ